MDATRSRRTRDQARRRWYANWRCRRLARHMGFPAPPSGDRCLTGDLGSPVPRCRP